MLLGRGKREKKRASDGRDAPAGWTLVAYPALACAIGEDRCSSGEFLWLSLDGGG